MLKAALVGCGRIAQIHAKAYASTHDVHLAAVVDIIPQRAEALGRKVGVPHYADVREVLSRSDIDMINVCVPSGVHGEVAIAAARAGKHCLCEKPLEVTPQRCDEMVLAFKKSGTALGGIFQHRYADGSRRAKEVIDAGRLGRITMATCATPWWRSQDYYDSDAWRGTWSLEGGGALMNQSIHAIDLLIWLAGPVRTVWARAGLLAHERIEVEDAAAAVVEFESGAIGTIIGTTAAFPGSPVRHEIMGTAGTVHLVDDGPVAWCLSDEMAARPKEGDALCLNAKAVQWQDSADLFARNIDDFACAVRHGGTPLITGEEHRRAVEVVCAVYESARSDRLVKLPLGHFSAAPKFSGGGSR